VTLADLVEQFPRLALDAGDTLLPSQLEDVSYLFVDDGLIVLRTALPDSTRRTITCHAGAGTLVLPPRADEVLVALTRAQLVPLSRDRCAVLVESPDAAALLLEALSQTLRQRQAGLAALAHLHHIDRVRQKLIQLAQDHGRVGRDGIRLDFPLTHDLLGEMTGSARETVTRALDELQREGFVVRNGRTYSVHVAPEDLGLTAV
jgi:CRP-like cAMP-binding protein